eukprot:snap_masked-scaffold_75-processed-gene-0.26-mRNA-1 protein AED:1.00 eAED:1.00 QI:0/0/0/0/1/1/2/0/179
MYHSENHYPKQNVLTIENTQNTNTEGNGNKNDHCCFFSIPSVPFAIFLALIGMYFTAFAATGQPDLGFSFPSRTSSPTSAPSLRPTISPSKSPTLTLTFQPTSFADTICAEKPFTRPDLLICLPDESYVICNEDGSSASGICASSCNCEDNVFVEFTLFVNPCEENICQCRSGTKKIIV